MFFPLVVFCGQCIDTVGWTTERQSAMVA